MAWIFIEGCECYDCKYAQVSAMKRDDSGIPDWLLQDNATYFRELHRVMDDVPTPLGVRISK
jgi:hypothetical protein